MAGLLAVASLELVSVSPAQAAVSTRLASSTATPLVTSQVEAETLSFPAGTGTVFADTAASGGQALLLWSTTTATGSLATASTASATSVVVRARGDQCDGAPSLAVYVDSVPVGTVAVTATSWTDYVFTGHWATGTHRVTVDFSNDYTSWCDRNLRVDKVTMSAATPSANSFAGAKFFTDPASPAREQANALSVTDPADAAEFAKIAGQPQADWFGSWVPAASLAAAVDSRTTQITAAGGLPVFVTYAIPALGCDPVGGLGSPAAYHAWMQQFAAGLKGRRAVVVLEPDALAQLDCLPAAAQTQRLAVLHDAVSVLSASSGVSTYLDAGNAGWMPVITMVQRLRAAGVALARGFSLNVSNFDGTASELGYGDQLAGQLPGAHFIVDTSRNGLGPATGALAWCNPAGRALGNRPTAATGDPAADAFFWVKRPGESDGDCGRGEPSAGVWWPWYGLGLAQRAAY